MVSWSLPLSVNTSDSWQLTQQLTWGGGEDVSVTTCWPRKPQSWELRGDTRVRTPSVCPRVTSLSWGAAALGAHEFARACRACFWRSRLTSWDLGLYIRQQSGGDDRLFSVVGFLSCRWFSLLVWRRRCEEDLQDHFHCQQTAVHPTADCEELGWRRVLTGESRAWF